MCVCVCVRVYVRHSNEKQTTVLLLSYFNLTATNTCSNNDSSHDDKIAAIEIIVMVGVHGQS